jgi:pimeloyl-ACP methyl ester carboxylesterase
MIRRVAVVVGRTGRLLACAVPALAVAACAHATSGAQAPVAPAQPVESVAGQATTAPAAAKALIARSADGTPIAYEVTGTGPALMLLHGAGQTRRSWKDIGYVDRLSDRFTVITLDQRGTGDSGKPLTADAYALDRVLGDLLAVADAAGAKQFHLWGFGQGATVGRYLAARSDRVVSAVLVGASMGPAVTGVLKDAIAAMRDKWQPLVDAQAAGTLDMKTLSPGERSAWESGVAVSVLALGALVDYPPLEPAEINVPTLWIVGAEDSSMEHARQYTGKLDGTKVTFKSLSSVSYSDSFIKTDQVLAEIEPFLAASQADPPQ